LSPPRIAYVSHFAVDVNQGASDLAFEQSRRHLAARVRSRMSDPQAFAFPAFLRDAESELFSLVLPTEVGDNTRHERADDGDARFVHDGPLGARGRAASAESSKGGERS